ncbi:MAG: hypothetical protein AAGG09_22155 [Pseudomonadota bacterium]
MPVEYWMILAVCIGVMALSAWFLGDENRQVRNLSRVGLVVSGTAAFVATIYFGAILVAVLVVMLPIALFLAWWNGLW